jgi:dTDP-glucose 4,6-dehydratase
MERGESVSDALHLTRIVVTGGAGFIGSHFIRHLLSSYDDCSVTNLDALRYSGNLENLREVADDTRYTFIHGDICDPEAVDEALRGAEAVVNFAAETHVDRAILGPGSFVQTDVVGSYTLLEGARRHGLTRYLQVSTDEVYGSLGMGSASESDPLRPGNPYSASKAGADLLVLSYHKTYGTPALVTRGSNTFGPNQYPEKLIPLFVTNLLDGKKVPLYGDGKNVRDWLFVADHCSGIDTVLRKGSPGEIYNIGGACERTNLEITHRLLELLDCDESSIERVTDRPGHDRRYSLNTEKIHSLRWRVEAEFDKALAETVGWYKTNRTWWEKIKSGEFREYYERQYGGRGSP